MDQRTPASDGRLGAVLRMMVVEQNVNLFGNFLKFVRGVSKLAGFFIFKLTVFSRLKCYLTQLGDEVPQ